MWPALIAGAAALGGSIWSAQSAKDEAKKNRDFQERMSSTSHQREVKDLVAAGIHPVAATRMGGASTPGGATAQVPDMGEAAGKAVGTGLAVRAAQAQVELLKAQANREDAQAGLARTQAADMQSTATGRYALLSSQLDVSQLDARQRREMLPAVLAKAQQEVQLTANSARAAKARALLDEFAASGAANVAAFEQQVGQAGPWAKALFNLLKALR